MKSKKTGKKKNENRKMKTPVYDGEGGKISPSCPIRESTLGVSMLLKKAALRRFWRNRTLRRRIPCPKKGASRSKYNGSVTAPWQRPVHQAIPHSAATHYLGTSAL
jgi:hypothetical protein